MSKNQFLFPNVNYKFPLYHLSFDVISCIDAANAKNIPLKNELKSLLLNYDGGICLVNVCGDNLVSLRKIKKTLHCKHAFMASEQELAQLNLRPGAVCPFLAQTWNLTQLYDKKLFALEFLSTNNGSRNQYIKFPPNVLLQCKDYIVGDFSTERS